MATSEKPKYAEYGARIRRARRRKGISQENFAPVIGITRRHLIRLEKGDNMASVALRERIAAATDSVASDFGAAPARDDEEDELASDLLRVLRAALRAADPQKELQES